jgi:hypothetical protein
MGNVDPAMWIIGGGLVVLLILLNFIKYSKKD